MNDTVPDPNDPQPTPGNPYPEPARPDFPSETPPDEPTGIPAPQPDPIPSPGEEPLQFPPDSPSEVPPEPGFPAPSAVRLIALAAAALLCWPGPGSLALAQATDGGAVTTDHPCQVQPGNGSNDEADGGSADGQGQDDAVARPSLDDCNGVLVPPKIGDQEIVEPAPDAGTTPVIPPGTVPAQPSKPEQP